MNTGLWIGGIVIDAVLAFLLGWFVRSQLGKARLRSAEQRAQSVIEDATREADSVKRDALLQGREEALRMKQDVEREMLTARNTQLETERAFQQKEAAFNRRVELIDKQERDNRKLENEISAREANIIARQGELDDLLAAQTAKLAKIAGMSPEQARDQLIATVENEARVEASKRATEIRENAQRNAEREARKTIVLAIQRYAGDHVSEASVSVVHLPSDDMKGRIIGREGRNIRAFEQMTGINLIIDDTPEAVILSSFDPVRREVGRITLESLLADGRIHPARIEEMFGKAEKIVEQQVHEAGEQAVFETQVHGLHAELVRTLGRLKFRTSYGQNVLKHSLEVSYLAGVMASELGVDVKLAKRAGLLHDLGKAIDHEVEGPHALIGAELAKRLGEHKEIVHCIEAHHGDVEAQTVEAVLVQAADAISASRPGARRETIESYIKRLEKLEELASAHKGVEKVYAMQAGREIRVMVKPETISDADSVVLARDIAKEIEEQMEYPGQVKVMVVRESRAIDYAK